MPIIKGKKVILFAPTFRGNGHGTAHYPFFKIDFERLARYCRSIMQLCYSKCIRFVKNRLNISREHRQYFIDVSDHREVNDILFVTDFVFNSDYSSLIYEYAVFKKPMIFYAFDLEDYITTRDFYEPYESFVPGKIVQSFDALMDALDNEDYEVEKVVPFLDKHFKYQDGRSSERLVKDLFKR
ncbi:CDP-glycerol glycerophosphotransferase family protein [Staphylococcus aureus]